MSPACYRFYVLQHKAQRGAVVEGTDRAARLVFEVIMSAPDLPAERKPPAIFRDVESAGKEDHLD